MTRDDIIKAMDWHPAAAEHGPQSLLARVERVVQQAIAAEREACAKVAAEYGPGRPIVALRPGERIVGRWEGEQAASAGISAAIIARGQA